MKILTELITRGVLVVGINDAVIFYVLNKRSQQITLPIAIGIILVTCFALVINIWYPLYLNGLLKKTHFSYSVHYSSNVIIINF